MSAMNMVIKSADKECRDPISKTKVRWPPISVYMDDLMITTSFVIGGRWLLKEVELIQWARMSFNPAKSRSLVLKRGGVAETI